ncbi:MAG: aminoacyltransferase [Bifidobacteriaceae bacterium]|nr:aminoacyltransferase [Bifidobacteriaceae bacterium]MCI1914203.1 aminoacyltransferase [Bifidobacteriaceae bacterium]
MLQIREITDRNEWNSVMESMSGHPMQAWEWGDLKAATGPWTAHRVVCTEGDTLRGAAQILVRHLPWPFTSICYAPRGPMVSDTSQYSAVADALGAWCKQRFHAVSLKIDPPTTTIDLSDKWKKGSHVLIASTAIVDLRPDEDDIMKSLHSRNARNYIRRGKKTGIDVRLGTADDVETVIDIYTTTAARDNFPIHTPEFYRTAFEKLGTVGQLIVAEHEGEILSFMWNVTSTWGASELWAGATDTGRKMRANYPLKWGAMLAAKKVGARRYDMNGLLNDGISEFKKSFQNEPTQWVGTFDLPLSPLFHVWEKSLNLYRSIRH